MAKDADSEEYVLLSQIRPGLKREFAFAMKSQSELSCSMGRTRARRSLNPVDNSKKRRSNNSVSNEKQIGVVELRVGEKSVTAEGVVLLSDEEEIKSDVVDDSPVSVGNAVEELSEERSEPVNRAKIENNQVLSNEGPKEDDVNHPFKGESGLEAVGQPPIIEKGQNELKSNETQLVDVGMEDVKREEVAENSLISDSVSTPSKSKLEMKMSKKISVMRPPTRLKELLDTGLLEDLSVRYRRGTKVKDEMDAGLFGIIKDSGILCHCETCAGKKVVTPNQFELHAGSSNKRPPEYIFLDSGNSLRDVLNACKTASPEGLEVAILNAIGGLRTNRCTFCLNCKASLTGRGSGRLQCDKCVAVKDSFGSSNQLPDSSARSPVSVQNISAPVVNSNSGRSRSHGKLTRKDLRMHKLVFAEDCLTDGTALAYYSRGQKLLEGYKKGASIFCFCCNSEVSPSQFEAHAGCGSRRKPYLHIYTSNGVSLHELSIRLSQERKFSADENDDLCSICADGGDLLLCDNCPRAFHPVCVSLPAIPQGTWYCKYCQNMFLKEKFVERNINALAAGRVAGVDPIEQITKRCIRIISTPESEISVCVLCRAQDFCKSVFGPRTVIICDQCEKEYHVGCLKEHNMDNLQELPEGKWFCCMDCTKIHSALLELVSGGEKLLPDALFSALKKKQEGKASESSTDLDIRWRLLCGKRASDETRVLLSKAVAIFHERFDPIADSTTSRLDLIPHMVYGRNLRDQEFGGMYCAILTVNSTVVSAGMFRVFGQEVAELPLVATGTECEGKGYFQSLFSCIESLLETLGVRSLVLPAAEEAGSIWTKKFGFQKISENELKQYRRNHQMMVFEGTTMLQKKVTSLAS